MANPLSANYKVQAIANVAPATVRSGHCAPKITNAIPLENDSGDALRNGTTLRKREFLI